MVVCFAVKPDDSVIKVIELVEAVCKRPKMYTLGGTFGEVFAMLDGIAIGEKRCKASSSCYLKFQIWLNRKLGYTQEENIRWQKSLGAYSNDENALEAFAAYWKEYVVEMNKLQQDIYGT